MEPKDRTDRNSLAEIAVVLGALGLVPIPGLPASIAAVVCGYAAGRHDGRARAAVILGWIGVAMPILLLAIYCLVLGNPFPIHRYQPGQ